ncbi:MAG: hypothetical protein IJ475_02150 [Bacilli bacterium]|nr:hypothetical protein [Bacilli bacterium]
MNKKVFVLIAMLFMLCGCSAEVNINLGETISEEINITYYEEGNVTKEVILDSFRNYIPVYYDVIIPDADPDVKKDGITYYKKEVTDLGNGYKISYSHNFNYNKYVKSRSMAGGFASPFIGTHSTTENNVISTGNNGCLYITNYPNLSEVKVNITTDYEVVSTNGFKNGNTYTWVFTPYDNNKSIYLEYKKKDKEETTIIDQEVKVNNQVEEEQSAFSKFANEHPFLLAICAVVIVLIVIVVVSKLQSNKYR